MSEKYEDGWYLVEHSWGQIRVRQIRDGGWCLGPDDKSPAGFGSIKIIRRVADLDGRPVVEASVEAENKRLREALEGLLPLVQADRDSLVESASMLDQHRKPIPGTLDEDVQGWVDDYDRAINTAREALETKSTQPNG